MSRVRGCKRRRVRRMSLVGMCVRVCVVCGMHDGQVEGRRMLLGERALLLLLL